MDELEKISQDLIDKFMIRLQDLTDELYAGKIDIGTWQVRMRAELRKMHAAQVIAASGGQKTDATWDDFQKLGNILKEQYRYLEKFAREIADGKVSALRAKQRAGLYAGATRATFWKTATGVAVKLPAYPNDGTTECRGYCKCAWRLDFERNKKGKVIAVLARWIIGSPPNCKTCLERSGKWNPLRIPVARGDEIDTEYFTKSVGNPDDRQALAVLFDELRLKGFIAQWQEQASVV